MAFGAKGITGRAHSSRLLIPRLLVDVGWNSHPDETRSYERASKEDCSDI
jgi:hypothetical protein